MNIVRRIDYILDRITMYRLTLYILVSFVLVSVVESFFGLLPFSPFSILASTALLVVVCVISNKVISKLFNAPTNVESSYITALILVLIVSPVATLQSAIFLVLVGVLAMASKYLLVFRKKHIFNPAAVAIVISGFVFAFPASWWVGTEAMAPFLITGGLILLRKLRFGQFAGVFLLVFAALTAFFTLSSGGDVVATTVQLVLNSSLIFMASVMLTEPQTLPGRNTYRYAYASLVALLSVPGLHFGEFYLYPEQALVIGNVFSFLVSQKGRHILVFKEKIELSKGVFEFVFSSSKAIRFNPGQYLEWTLPHPFTDRRGARRFFTIASSPEDNEVRIGVKFDKEGSSFKDALLKMKPGSAIAAANLWGGFTLPKKERKFALIAGGIGVTPYASMIRYLLTQKEKRDVVLIYSNTHMDEISYKDTLDKAAKELGIKIVYTLTGDDVPASWEGEKDRLSAEMLEKHIPDFKERLFYVSGSKPLLDGVKKTLKEAGVGSNRIRTDYFPGYA